jgi:membrane protein implicated in regulation of membrane protease activity
VRSSILQKGAADVLWVYLVCAAVGSTILLGQLLISAIGFGGDWELADDVPDDVPHDLGASHDFQPDPELGEHAVGHGDLSSWLFGMLSFKALTAAAAFFGLAGCAANAAQLSPSAQLTIACLAGLSALYGVHSLMRSLRRLSENGTLRIERATGKEGVVYLTIPAQRLGPGKIQFKLQNRLVEYAAITSADDPLPTGTKIRIVGVVGPGTLEVEPWVEPKPSAEEATSSITS